MDLIRECQLIVEAHTSSSENSVTSNKVEISLATASLVGKSWGVLPLAFDKPTARVYFGSYNSSEFLTTISFA